MRHRLFAASLFVAASTFAVSLTLAAQDRFSVKVPNGLGFSEFKATTRGRRSPQVRPTKG